MTFRQTMMLLETIMKNPGLTISELALKMEEEFGADDEAIELLSLNNTSEKSQIMSLVPSLYCVEKKEDRYFFVRYLYQSVRDENDIMQVLIRNTLEGLEERGLLEKYDAT